jgi:5-methylcytosine-specific restriction endonuclease McrA
MPLKPLPADPQPTEEELQAVKDRLKRSRGPERLTHHFLIFEWRQEAKKADPNSFRVPFRPKEIDYEAYLSSGPWKKIRRRVLRIANWRCAGCGGEATEVHHRDYRPRVMSGDDITPLVALCTDCHKFIHQPTEQGPKTWEEEDALLIALVEDFETKATQDNPIY